MAAGAEREADPTKKTPNTGNKLCVGDVIFQILFNFVLMFLRQRKNWEEKLTEQGG